MLRMDYDDFAIRVRNVVEHRPGLRSDSLEQPVATVDVIQVSSKAEHHDESGERRQDLQVSAAASPGDLITKPISHEAVEHGPACAQPAPDCLVVTLNRAADQRTEMHATVPISDEAIDQSAIRRRQEANVMEDLCKVGAAALESNLIMTRLPESARLRRTFGKTENDNLWRLTTPRKRVIRDPPLALFGSGLVELV
ncbi:hypothetical protein N182_13635 [Sinorhizobium sp. GL2]|nr:hypothetical protein N182_13635 [Sinorhizobium sp. GL2]